MGGKISTSSKNKWNAAHYDRVSLMLPKGKKDIIQEHANQQGETVNRFINRSIDNQMERDKLEKQGLED